ncbi:MAG: YggS family pyridoxal phosphate-dependent enzyme, partial [Opitutae bacterium]
MISKEDFLSRLAELRTKIANACTSCGRNPDDVCLLPVTKNWPIDAVRYCQDAGLSRVGENRVQEAVSKQDQISGISWELIGHLQTNKVNQVVGRFARIQTLDSIKLIHKVEATSERFGQTTSVLLQINAGNDPAKYGFSIEEAPSALDEVLGCSHLQVDGLMTIAPYAPDDVSVARDCFQKLADLRDKLSRSHGIKLTELSMG